MREIAAFDFYGRCGSQTRADPVFCPATIDPYTQPFGNLHGDQMDKNLLYMAGEEANICWLRAKTKMPKRDRLWEMLFLHVQNTLVHPSKRMLVSLGELTTPPPPREIVVR